MSALSRCSMTLGLAAALGALIAFASPANAQFQHSNNCVKQNVPIQFNADDIGKIVDLAYENCGKTATTTLFNGIYRRVSNQPNPSAATDVAPLQSAGDARHDMVVYDSDFQKKRPCNGGGTSGGIVVSSDCIAAQIGFSFTPAITLAATVSVDNSTNMVTVTDTTGAGRTDGYPEGQLVDAGPGLGGFDCAMLIKNGIPKTADIICDMNMWYEDNFHKVQYGFRDYAFGQPVNRIILMWLMGPNPTGSMTVTNGFCNAVNAGGKLPSRDFAGNTLALTQDPSSYQYGNSILREEWSMAASTSYIQLYGEHPSAFNLISCLGTATYCDNGELPPDPNAMPVARLSGNSCTQAPGTAAPPDFRVTSTIPNNSSFTQGGALGTGGSSLSCPYGTPPC